MERTDETLTAAFAEVIRRRRVSAGLTQQQLAELADVSTRHISFVETNRRQPTMTIIAALSQGLGITLAEFAGEIEATWLAAKDVTGPEKLIERKPKRA